MTEEQIKEMLNGIINNGEKWERKANYSNDCEWHPYKLGEGIHEDWEYRKAETWLEEYLENYFTEHTEYSLSRRGDLLGGIRIGAIEVCKKILEEIENRNPKGESCFYCNMRDELLQILRDLGIEL